MKITKTASGKQVVKISKSEWQNIGKKAGWMKVANDERSDEFTQWIYQKFGGPGTVITFDQLYQIKDQADSMGIQNWQSLDDVRTRFKGNTADEFATVIIE